MVLIGPTPAGPPVDHWSRAACDSDAADNPATMSSARNELSANRCMLFVPVVVAEARCAPAFVPIVAAGVAVGTGDRKGCHLTDGGAGRLPGLARGGRVTSCAPQRERDRLCCIRGHAPLLSLARRASASRVASR